MYFLVLLGPTQIWDIIRLFLWSEVLKPILQSVSGSSHVCSSGLYKYANFDSPTIMHFIYMLFLQLPFFLFITQVSLQNVNVNAVIQP
jgi:hypothetical protein